MNNLLQKLVLGSSATAMFAAAPLSAAFAQADDQNIEQVVVSASRITIAGYSQPTPVTVVGAAQLAQDAYANIQDSIRQMPQFNSPNATQTANQGGSFGVNGANFLNLRSLGTIRTLILLDGQRTVVSTNGGAVDVTNFPSPLIQRVDIVTGGASAAWGSDAVAGVVNYVLNKNFSGFKATLQAGDTTDNKDRSLYGEAAWGGDISGERGHIELAGSARVMPDTLLLTDEKWFRGAYWVSNPAYVAGSSLPQMIVANNVGYSAATPGGLIISSPAGVAGPGVSPAAVNALRGIQFTGGGIPSIVNFGNNTRNTLSNGGSLTTTDSQLPWQLLANPSNSYTGFGYARYKLTDTIQLSGQIDLGYYTGKGEDGDSPRQTVTIKSDNAYLPATVASAMQNGGITSFSLGTLQSNNTNNNTLTGKNFWAQIANSTGPVTTLNHHTFERGVLSLDGTLGDDWAWTAYYEHSASRVWAQILGNPLNANLLNAEDAVTVTSANVAKTGLALGSIACRSTLTGTTFLDPLNSVAATSGCIPLDPFGNGVASPAAIAYANGYGTNAVSQAHQSVQQDVAEGSMQGTLPWALPAGKVAVAFGVGYRKEQAYSTGVNNNTLIGQFGGYSELQGLPFPSRSYNVIEGFGEVDAPILKNNIVNALDFTMAGRMTSYSNSGLVETWKLGATSQVNDDIKLRTTWSVDIRAPGLSELYNVYGTVNTQNQTDPKNHNTIAVNVITASNPNLVPEVARTISGGVVLTPTFIPGLTLSADWYNINLTGEITSLPVSTLIAACDNTANSPTNPGQKGSFNDPLCTAFTYNAAGQLVKITNALINIASQRTSGLDIQANYVTDFWDGTLNLATTDSLNDENTVATPGSVIDVAGSSSFNIQNQSVPGPKWRGVASATYSTGPYNFTVQGRWWGTSVVDSSGNTGNLATAATANLYDPAHFHVPFSAYLDLRGNYKWNDNISFFAAVDNTLDTPPPLKANIGVANGSGASAAIGIGGQVFQTPSVLYDLLGRTVRVGIRLAY